MCRDEDTVCCLGPRFLFVSYIYKQCWTDGTTGRWWAGINGRRHWLYAECICIDIYLRNSSYYYCLWSRPTSPFRDSPPICWFPSIPFHAADSWSTQAAPTGYYLRHAHDRPTCLLVLITRDLTSWLTSIVERPSTWSCCTWRPWSGRPGSLGGRGRGGRRRGRPRRRRRRWWGSASEGRSVLPRRPFLLDLMQLVACTDFFQLPDHSKTWYWRSSTAHCLPWTTLSHSATLNSSRLHVLLNGRLNGTPFSLCFCLCGPSQFFHPTCQRTNVKSLLYNGCSAARVPASFWWKPGLGTHHASQPVHEAAGLRLQQRGQLRHRRVTPFSLDVHANYWQN
jgi:hypothetical protein